MIEFQVGTQARITGLLGDAVLNGQPCVTLTQPTASRVQVRLASGREIAVRVGNLDLEYSPGNLPEGFKVLIIGLQKAGSLNGREGKISSGEAPEGRVLIDLEDDGEKAIKYENLILGGKPFADAVKAEEEERQKAAAAGVFKVPPKPVTGPSPLTVAPPAAPGAEKPIEIEWNKDWLCIHCNASNFSNRLICRQCNNPRPGTEKGVGKGVEQSETCLYVVGLDEKYEAEQYTEELNCLFAKHGEIQRLAVPTDHETKKVRGFAFVNYTIPSEALEAIDKCNGLMFLGKRIKVQLSNRGKGEGKSGITIGAGGTGSLAANVQFNSQRDDMDRQRPMDMDSRAYRDRERSRDRRGRSRSRGRLRCLDGKWTEGTISGSRTLGAKLVWNSGKEVPLDMIDDKSFNMNILGKTYSAKLKDDGKLHFSDGDVWEMKEPARQARSPPRDSGRNKSPLRRGNRSGGGDSGWLNDPGRASGNPSFIAAERHTGFRPGMVYKAGPKGLGYYVDDYYGGPDRVPQGTLPDGGGAYKRGIDALINQAQVDAGYGDPRDRRTIQTKPGKITPPPTTLTPPTDYATTQGSRTVPRMVPPPTLAQPPSSALAAAAGLQPLGGLNYEIADDKSKKPLSRLQMWASCAATDAAYD